MSLKALLFFLLVVIHLISSLPMEQPMIMADELGYLGTARFLAGQAHLPDMAGARFYHFGYSLLLVPAFWLFDDPLTAYRAALILNAFLMGSLFPALRGIINLLGWVSRRVALWIAFTCCLYPPIVLYSNFAWAENAFIPAYALALLLLARFLRSRSMREALYFGVMAGLLYAIHPRALPVVILAGGYLLLLAILSSVGRRQALVGAAAVGLVFGLTHIGNRYLQVLGWEGTGAFSALQLGSRLLPGDQSLSLILRAAGQLFYLAVSTHGLFLLGILAAVVYLWRRGAARGWRRAIADPQVGMLIFLLLSGAGILAGSTTLKVYSLFDRETIRAANLIFGRYNEAFAVVMAALGGAWLWRSRFDRRRRSRQVLLVAAGLLALTTLTLWQVRIAAIAAEPDMPWKIEAINIAGVYPFVDLFGMSRLFLASLGAVSVFVVLSVSMRLSLGGSLAFLAALFGATTLYLERVDLAPARKATADHLSFIPELRRLGPPAALDYDFAFRDYRVFYGAQYRLPETVFHRFDSRREELPTSEVVLSGKGWRQSRTLDARLVVAAAAGDTAVWVLPGEVRRGLASPNLLGVNIGVEPGLGVEEWGFFPPEEVSGATVRWTQGTAVLRLPWSTATPPASLMVELATPDPTGTEIQITANEVELWNGWIPETWSRSFRLAEVPEKDSLTIELESDTLNPSRDIPGATDNRELGVQVRTIRLVPASNPPGPSYLDKVLGYQPIPGVDESGFHATETLDQQLVRWTNGAAMLHVPIDPKRPPRALEIEVSCPGQDEARLLILANGVELWEGEVPEQGLSTILDLNEVPLRPSLRIELRSESFVPAQTMPGSTDTRRLGVLVEKIRLARARD